MRDDNDENFNSTECKKYIETLRQSQFQLDIDLSSVESLTRIQLEESRDNLHRDLNNALRLLSDDLYTKETHFVLELIQNADDNEYADGVVPFLEIFVGSEQLIVCNNERGFSPDNVKAICRIGGSTKEKKAGYIGEKGIGFKSVFKVSDRPEIHSNGFHFRFDKSDENAHLGYVVPEWINKSDNSQYPEITKIVLPAKVGVSFSEDTLSGISPEALLFLNKLKKIKVIHTANASASIAYQLVNDGDINTLLITKNSGINVSPKTETVKFLKLNFGISMVDAPNQDKRPGICDSEIVLAFPLKANGKADSVSPQKIFAFLPINNFGFRFLIQADFLLTANREGLHEDFIWNQAIRDEIPRNFALSVEKFKLKKQLARSFLHFVPKEGEVTDSFFAPITSGIFDELKKCNCILTESGSWRKPDDVFMVDNASRALISNVEVIALLNKEFIHSEFDAPIEALNTLGCHRFRPSHLVQCFSDKKWTESKTNEWFSNFFTYLTSWAINDEFIQIIKKASCFRLLSGVLTSLSEGEIFFPLKGTSSYGFENDLRILPADILNIAVGKGDEIQKLLMRIGIQPADVKLIINHHILPLHSGEKWKECDDTVLLGHVRYIKENIDQYLPSTASPSTIIQVERSKLLQILGTKLWLKTKSGDDTTRVYSLAKDLYLGDQYLPNVRLEEMLGDKAPIHTDSFMSVDYLRPVKKNKKEKTKELIDLKEITNQWRSFFFMIGVAEYPRILKKVLPHDGFDYLGDECFNDIADNQKQRVSFVEMLDKYWTSYYKQFLVATEYTVKRGGWRSGPNNRATAFLNAIRAMEVPTTKRQMVKITDGLLDKPELHEIFGENAPFLKLNIAESQFIEAVGITTKADLAACLKRLTQLRNDNKTRLTSVAQIYRVLLILSDKHQTEIRNVFLLNKLIFVPDATQNKWRSMDSVCWQPNGALLDQIYTPLQEHYREFQDFFTKKIGVVYSLSPEKLIGGLRQLETFDASPEERQMAGLDIYRRLDKILRSLKAKEPTAEQPVWLDDFYGEALLLDTKGRIREVNDGLFIDDRPDVAKLFADSDEISFFCASGGQLTLVSSFVETSRIPRLSESIIRSIGDINVGEIDEDFTVLVRAKSTFLMRVLYAKDLSSFESFVEQGMAEYLQTITVRRPKILNVNISLNDHVAVSDEEVFSDKKNILIKQGVRGAMDKLAAELCRYLNLRIATADLLSLILREQDIDDIEDMLLARGIGEIPESTLKEIIVRIEKEDVEPVALENESAAITSMGVLETEVSQPPSIVAPLDNASTTIQPGELKEGKVDSQLGGTNQNSPRGVNKEFNGESNRQGQTGQVEGGSSSGGSNRYVHDGDVPSRGSDERQPFDSSEFNSSPPILEDQNEQATITQTSEKGKYDKNSEPDKGANPYRQHKGRFVSYVFSDDESGAKANNDSEAAKTENMEIGRAAAQWAIEMDAKVGRIVEPMSHENEGFDLLHRLADGEIEYIEVKGSKGPWTESGVSVSPSQIRYASKYMDKFWLYVVEYALDPERRRLWRIKNPFGQATQFNFDSGWKKIAEDFEPSIDTPTVGFKINIPGRGIGEIIEVVARGQFFKIQVQFDVGGRGHITFVPGKMILIPR